MTVFVVLEVGQTAPLMVLSQPNVDHLLPRGAREVSYKFKHSYGNREIVGEWEWTNGEDQRCWRLVAYSVVENLK
jgi:hypothetical protein